MGKNMAKQNGKRGKLAEIREYIKEENFIKITDKIKPQ